MRRRVWGSQPIHYVPHALQPEMALAIEDFGALCGFLPHEELAKALEAHPEVKTCIGESLYEQIVAGTSTDPKTTLR